MQELRGPQLAAVLAALVMPEVITRPGMRAATQASEEALDAVFALDPLQAHLSDLQQDLGLMLPLEMDVRLAGVSLQTLIQGASVSLLHQLCCMQIPAVKLVCLPVLVAALHVNMPCTAHITPGTN